MPAIVLDGKTLSQQTEAELAKRVAAIHDRSGGLTPILATILVGDDPASATYVRMKQNACKRVGMESLAVEMSSATTTAELLAKIAELNANPRCHGILLQHPVPSQIDERACFDAIALDKDVDGVTCLGFGRMAMGEHAWGSATPAGIMRLLAAYEIALSGRHAVVVGRSPILGKPMALMLLNAHCTVTICHSRTRDLSALVRQADIVVGAVGKPEFIRAALDQGRSHRGGCRISPWRDRRYRARTARTTRCRVHAGTGRSRTDDDQYADIPDRAGRGAHAGLSAFMSACCTPPPRPASSGRGEQIIRSA